MLMDIALIHHNLSQLSLLWLGSVLKVGPEVHVPMYLNAFFHVDTASSLASFVAISFQEPSCAPEA